MEIIEIPLSKLLSDKDNPRKSFEDIEELATSIQQNGQEKPVDVENLGDGTYLIDDGHRRVEAFKVIQKRTKKEPMVKCIVKESLSDTDRLMKRCAIENQHHSWTVEDRDKAWEKLWKSLSVSKKEFGDKLGANALAIDNFFDRISLDEEIKDLDLGMNQIAETRGMDPELRKKLLKRVAKEGIGRQQVRDIKSVLNNTKSDLLKDAVVEGELGIDDAKKLDGLSEERQKAAIDTIKWSKEKTEELKKEIMDEKATPRFKEKAKEDKRTITAYEFVEKLRDQIDETSNNVVVIKEVIREINEQDLDKFFSPRVLEILAKSLEELVDSISEMEDIKENIQKWRPKK